MWCIELFQCLIPGQFIAGDGMVWWAIVAAVKFILWRKTTTQQNPNIINQSVCRGFSPLFPGTKLTLARVQPSQSHYIIYHRCFQINYRISDIIYVPHKKSKTIWYTALCVNRTNLRSLRDSLRANANLFNLQVTEFHINDLIHSICYLVLFSYWFIKIK